MIDLEVFLPEIEDVAPGETEGTIWPWRGQLRVDVLNISSRGGVKVSDLCGGGPDAESCGRVDDGLGAHRCGKGSLQLRSGGHLSGGKRSVVDHAPPFLREKEEGFLGVQIGNEYRSTE